MDQKNDFIKRLEHENKTLKEQLSRSEANMQSGYLKEILRYNKEVVLVITYDGEGTVEDVSDGISCYGYSPDEFISGKLSYWDIIYSDDLDKLKNTIDKKTNQSGKVFDFEHRIRNEAGETA